LPLIVVEFGNERHVQSINDLISEKSFWSIHSMQTWYAESLLGETNNQLTLSTLLNTLGASVNSPIQFPTLSNYERVIKHAVLCTVFSNRELDSIVAYEDQRRVDIRWVFRNKNNPIWLCLINESTLSILREMERRFLLERRGSKFIRVVPNDYEKRYFIPMNPIQSSGCEQFDGIRIGKDVFIHPKSPICNYLVQTLKTPIKNPEMYALIRSQLYKMILGIESNSISSVSNSISKYIDETLIEPLKIVFPDKTDTIRAILRPHDLEHVLTTCLWKLFDPYAWRREKDNE